MFFILYKKKHRLPSGFHVLKWDLRMSISYLYHYSLVISFLDFLNSRLVFFLLFFYSFVPSFIHLFIHPLKQVRDQALLNYNRR